MTTAALVPTTGQEAPTLTPFEVIERVITSGDLAGMHAQDRVAFYWRTCESLGLNPLTRPFEFIQLNGKLTMYARKDATDQLRRLNKVSVTGIRREKDDDLGLITVYATGVDGSGRTDEAEGVVSIKGLSGEALANALMKASTKAKRRLTLSLVGLGFLDESEVDDRGDVQVDPTTGEITERAKPKSLLESVQAQQEAMAAPATDAPGAGAEPETPTASTPPENAAASPSDVEEGVVRDAPAPSTGLTREALIEALRDLGISTKAAADRSKAMWPDRDPEVPLDDAQRADLFVALQNEQAATAGL